MSEMDDSGISGMGRHGSQSEEEKLENTNNKDQKTYMSVAEDSSVPGDEMSGTEGSGRRDSSKEDEMEGSGKYCKTICVEGTDGERGIMADEKFSSTEIGTREDEVADAEGNDIRFNTREDEMTDEEDNGREDSASEDEVADAGIVGMKGGEDIANVNAEFKADFEDDNDRMADEKGTDGEDTTADDEDIMVDKDIGRIKYKEDSLADEYSSNNEDTIADKKNNGINDSNMGYGMADEEGSGRKNRNVGYGMADEEGSGRNNRNMGYGMADEEGSGRNDSNIGYGMADEEGSGRKNRDMGYGMADEEGNGRNDNNIGYGMADEDTMADEEGSNRDDQSEYSSVGSGGSGDEYFSADEDGDTHTPTDNHTLATEHDASACVDVTHSALIHCQCVIVASAEIPCMISTAPFSISNATISSTDSTDHSSIYDVAIPSIDSTETFSTDRATTASIGNSALSNTGLHNTEMQPNHEATKQTSTNTTPDTTPKHTHDPDDSEQHWHNSNIITELFDGLNNNSDYSSRQQDHPMNYTQEPKEKSQSDIREEVMESITTNMNNLTIRDCSETENMETDDTNIAIEKHNFNINENNIESASTSDERSQEAINLDPKIRDTGSNGRNEGKKFFENTNGKYQADMITGEKEVQPKQHTYDPNKDVHEAAGQNAKRRQEKEESLEQGQSNSKYESRRVESQRGGRGTEGRRQQDREERDGHDREEGKRQDIEGHEHMTGRRGSIGGKRGRTDGRQDLPGGDGEGVEPDGGEGMVAEWDGGEGVVAEWDGDTQNEFEQVLARISPRHDTQDLQFPGNIPDVNPENVPDVKFEADPSIPEVNFEIDPERVVLYLARREGLRAPLRELHQVFSGPTQCVLDVVRLLPHVFRHAGDDVRLSPTVRICSPHQTPDGCPDPSVCLGLHICLDYATAACQDQQCPMGHRWATNHNKGVLNAFFIDNIQPSILKRFLNEPDTDDDIRGNKMADKLIGICDRYCNEGCDNNMCPDLHICHDFVVTLGRCSRLNCRLNHNILSRACQCVLNSHGIDTNESPLDVLRSLLEMNPAIQHTQVRQGQAWTPSLQDMDGEANITSQNQLPQSVRPKNSSPRKDSVMREPMSSAQKTGIPTPLDVCMDYNRGKCHSRECKALHICYQHLVSVLYCHDPSCKLNHSLERENCSHLLKARGMYRAGNELVMALELIEKNKKLSSDAAHNQQPHVAAGRLPENYARGGNHAKGSNDGRESNGYIPNKSTQTASNYTHGNKNSPKKKSMGENLKSLISKFVNNEQIIEICSDSITNSCRSNACKKIHAISDFLWQISDDVKHWVDLPWNHMNDLETAFTHPKWTSAGIPKLDGSRPHTNLYKLLQRDDWHADFTYIKWHNTCAIMYLRNQRGNKCLSLRRLCIESPGSCRANTFLWYFLDARECWIMYGRPDSQGTKAMKASIASADIEEAFNVNKGGKITFENKIFDYELDFTRMTQRNNTSGTVREVCRRPAPFSHTNKKY